MNLSALAGIDLAKVVSFIEPLRRLNLAEMTPEMVIDFGRLFGAEVSPARANAFLEYANSDDPGGTLDSFMQRPEFLTFLRSFLANPTGEPETEPVTAARCPLCNGVYELSYE